MSSHRADRSRRRSHARRKGTPPARGIALALSAATMAAGAGLTVAAGGGQDGPAGRVTADAADTAHDTAGGTSGGSSLPASPTPEGSASASPGAGRTGEPEKPARGAAPSASAPAPASAGETETGRTAGGEQGRETGSEGAEGSGGSGGGNGGKEHDGAPGADPAPKDSGPEAQVLALVNKERAAAGCGPVTANARLTRAADGYSDTMAASGVLSHTGPDGSTMADRVEAAGYAWSNLGENIARGQPDAASVMDAWMNSPGHRANILNCAFEELGVGVHFGDGGPWWTQNFGAGRP
ncbi:CAP domain-containing protein [Streptomyces nanhaiensis]|uniref:CAP domain-containing protein n=1 Tax=Streptomyces nanhaiensis TaxID=679319 RepID=UPI00399D41DF